MIDYSLITPEMAKELPPDKWWEWVNYDPPVPSPSEYHLGSNEGRCAFLDSFIWYGEDKLFEAVNHAWNSLAHPRPVKCIYIGMWAGTGGSGKWALAKVLKQALREWLDYDVKMPLGERYSNIHDYHAAATDFWAAQAVYHQGVIQKYADILNGEPGRHAPMPSTVIQGPWPALRHCYRR